MTDDVSAPEESRLAASEPREAGKHVLVTAAGGHQGKLLVPKLAAEGFRVRAVRATPGKEQELLDLGADEAIAADLSDVDRYAEVLDGIDTVYHVGPGASHVERGMGEALIEAGTRVGVEHIVYSSVLHSIIPIIQHQLKRDLEVQLIESGLNFTVLKPVDFMLPEVYSLPAFAAHIFPVAWSLDRPRRGSLIALDDLTDVAVKVIKEGAHHYFASYELVGPDKLTAFEIAETLSRVTGNDVQAVAWTPEDLFQAVVGGESSSPAASYQMAVIKSISQWYGQYNFIGNPNVLAWLLGRKPTSYEEFVTKEYAEYQQHSSQPT